MGIFVSIWFTYSLKRNSVYTLEPSWQVTGSKLMVGKANADATLLNSMVNLKELTISRRGNGKSIQVSSFCRNLVTE